MAQEIVTLECTEAKALGKPASRYMTTRNKKSPRTPNRLEKKKYNPFCMAWKINDSTYTLQLPNNWNISHTFNMANLFAYHPYDEELYEPNFRMSSFSNERD